MRDYDIFGEAISDYFYHGNAATIIVHEIGEEDDYLDPEYLFRSPAEMPEIELEALRHCKGKVLDVGAGAGSHSLYLQDKGFEVTAIDVSAKAVQIMNLRGLKDAKVEDYFKLSGEQKYDTLLFLMNGIGITGTLSRVDDFFYQAKNLLSKDGCLIIESSNLLYNATSSEKRKALRAEKYFGELEFQMEYKERLGTSFSWLYLDLELLKKYAQKSGFEVELLYKDSYGAFLVKVYQQ